MKCATFALPGGKRSAAREVLGKPDHLVDTVCTRRNVVFAQLKAVKHVCWRAMQLRAAPWWLRPRPTPELLQGERSTPEFVRRCGTWHTQGRWSSMRAHGCRVCLLPRPAVGQLTGAWRWLRNLHHDTCPWSYRLCALYQHSLSTGCAQISCACRSAERQNGRGYVCSVRWSRCTCRCAV
jgi:hypothetical protein